MKTSEEPVILEADFNCPHYALWDALTDPKQMRQWFFGNIPHFKPFVGFKTEFMVDAGERKFLHQWEITEVKPLEKIAWRWRYKGYAGAAQSVFELQAKPQGTKQIAHLRLSFPVEEDFADDIPEFERESCVGGWTYFLGELRAYVEKA